MLRIAVVSFNENEAAAVDRLLDDLLTSPSPWSRDGTDAIRTEVPRQMHIRHLAVRAQGNVIAAARLAEQFASSQVVRPDVAIFYGCAGAVNPADVGGAYIVASATYVSLGTVEYGVGPNAVEVVTLKSKWLAHTTAGVEPLLPVQFLDYSGLSVPGLPAALLSTCHVSATDKVIKVGPAGSIPAPVSPGPPHLTYAAEGWTYAEAIAFVAAARPGDSILVDMESYGIGLVSSGLGLQDRVVVLRIATDDLVNHAKSDQDQRDLLLEGRHALLSVIHAIVFPYQEAL